MKQSAHILMLSDYGKEVITGFATVANNIVKNLKRHYGHNLLIDIVAINYFGKPYKEYFTDGEKRMNATVNVIGAQVNDPNKDDFGRVVFGQLLNDGNYDGIFIIQDITVVTPFIPVLQKIKQDKKDGGKKLFKSVFYFPVDCILIDGLLNDIEFFDTLVTYTEYGREQVCKIRPDLRKKLQVVYHGTDTNIFYPLPEEEKKRFRYEYFQENAEKFIVNNTNRNQWRKDIPCTMLGFQHAKEIWPEYLPAPFLYLHMHPEDPKGWQIRQIARYLNLIEGKDYMLPRYAENGPLMMNNLYNASDVYLTTTQAEGWGLGITESFAAQLPVICPSHTSLKEISQSGANAFVMDTLFPVINTEDNIIRDQVDYMEVAGKLEHVATMKVLTHVGELEEMGKKVERAYKWVNKYTWAIVCERWIEYFKIYY